MTQNIGEESILLHANGGKLTVLSSVPVETSDDLLHVYTPGVGAVCTYIYEHPEAVYTHTMKGHMVAVVSDGSAVLGLGNLGAEASLPVMEGKAALFKRFAGIDAFPIVLATNDIDEIVRTCELLAPGFGGINLEDISAPRCFEIEERLRSSLSIPVMHDDQWGAATVTLTALINASKLAGKNLQTSRILINGVGAAGVATARLLFAYGAHNVIFCDSKGVIHSGRTDLTKEKQELLSQSSASVSGTTLSDAFVGVDVAIGLSKAGAFTKDMVATMSSKGIVFALANPAPEIYPEEALSSGAFVVGTGRSDFPNQINNSLVFPGAFKAMLALRDKQFEPGVFAAIAEALAVFTSTHGEVTSERVLPGMFEEGVAGCVEQAVFEYFERKC